MQYYEVPVEVLKDATELARWARKAVTVATNARARKNTQTRRARVR